VTCNKLSVQHAAVQPAAVQRAAVQHAAVQHAAVQPAAPYVYTLSIKYTGEEEKDFVYP